MPRSAFRRELDRINPSATGRRWIYVPYDQLTDAVGPLATEPPDSLAIAIIESPGKAARRPYHQQKLALVLANGRHFALEQARRGVHVRHLIAEDTLEKSLSSLAHEVGPLRVMRAAERELRVELQALAADGTLDVIPHAGWLTSTAQFDRAMRGKQSFRMDAFYRRVREDSGILMTSSGEPEGGKWSFDAENREPWNGSPPAPALPTFDRDPIKDEVLQLVAEHYGHHPGRLDGAALPTTAADAKALVQWAMTRCLPHFGPYEDALSREERTLFHTRVSGLLNLCRILPQDLVRQAERSKAPLASREGFIRQILGWREFVRHVHERTDGFRSLPDGREVPELDAPGDGGHARWLALEGRSRAAKPTRKKAAAKKGPRFGGAEPSHLGAAHPVPPAYWGRKSGLACLDDVVRSVWEEGYSHHITRLMVLGNLATLLDISPRDLTDWFWVAYVDAYDWVVEPNVLGMATFAVGELMTTKPYVSGAAYIDKMGDHCAGCRFDPAKNCPITRLYWAFLARHREALAKNVRMAMPMRSLEKRSEEKRLEDARAFDHVHAVLEQGATLEPKSFLQALGGAP